MDNHRKTGLYYVTTLLLVMIVTSSDEYDVEVRVVADLLVIEKWTNLTGKTIDDFPLYINETFQEINKLYYNSLSSYQLFINLVVKDLVMLDKNLGIPYSKEKRMNMNCMKLLSAFARWVKRNNTEDINKRYDLSILFTGYDLFFGAYDEKDDATSGLSSVGRVCSPIGAVGVVEFSGTRKDAFVASHEIGHILGAWHDGKTGAETCNTTEGYVMSQIPKVTTPNHIYFSSCSAKLIMKTIRSLDLANINCLVRSVP